MRRVIPAGAHRTSASFVAALTSRPGRYSCMGGTGREKGIVVSVAPAGPMSGADRRFRPGSSGAQQAHKRMRTSIAQRVAPMRAIIRFAKRELCEANEGMTHAHTHVQPAPMRRPITDRVQRVVGSERPDQCRDARIANAVASKAKLCYHHHRRMTR